MIEYAVRESARARRMSLTVYPGGKVVLTMPKRRFKSGHAEDFIMKHSRWLERALKKLAHVPPKVPLPGGVREYRAQKFRALNLVRKRLQYFNQFYGLKLGKISIRNQKSRWGSCSRRGDLSFNFKIVHLPPTLADYIIVHELCHIKEHNHSRNFWAHVAKAMPDYRQLRRELSHFSLR